LKKRPCLSRIGGVLNPLQEMGGTSVFFHDHFRQQMATPVSSIEQIT